MKQPVNQNVVQVLISTCSLACIAINMPSKTQQYNWANLLSRLLIIVTFLSTIVLESDRDPSVRIHSNEIGLSALSQVLSTN